MSETTVRSGPWWRYGHVWLIISGPAIVVVAALFTAWLAVRTPDPVVEDDYYQRGLRINQVLAREKALLPALHGRNHAATPPAKSP